MEDSERIVTGDIKPIIHSRFIKQGYKPYKTKDGKLIPLDKITRTNMDYSKGYEDNTVYFLSDKEVEYAKKVQENMDELIKLKYKQIGLLKQYLPAFIREILNKKNPSD